MPTQILKPIVLNSDGLQQLLPDGAIINAGGTGSPTFTVGGKGLIFSDGTNTDGSGVVALTLQSIYNASVSAGSPAVILLKTGGDFIINDSTATEYFKIDATSGKVTITGDLEVHGASSIIDTVIQDSDHWLISPHSGSTVALRIEPDAGATPAVDLLQVVPLHGEAATVVITHDGTLIANGVVIKTLAAEVTAHLTKSSVVKHAATEIAIDPIAALQATTVQSALEELSAKEAASNVTMRGHTFAPAAAQKVWAINHGLASTNVQYSIWADNHSIIADDVEIIDANNIVVSFGAPQLGKIIIVAF